MSMELTSPAFDDGDSIPRKYGRREANVNPPLSIDGLPDGTASVAIVVDDPDAMEPAGKVWDHWVVWNVDPDDTEIPEDSDPGAAGAVEGSNDFGTTGYGGPDPPDREHSYRFRAYALDATIDLDAGATKADLVSAMQGHVLDQAELHGTYAP
jgi:hypothetical protein